MHAMRADARAAPTTHAGRPSRVQAMRDYLDRFWDRALAAFKLAAEQEDT